MTALAQKEINRSLEVLMSKLVKQANVEQFTNIIQQNIDTKRLSAQSETDFFDRLMLNITYFVDNKTFAADLIHQLIDATVLPSKSMVESKVIEKQMFIRENIASKMDDYKAIFHNQYTSLNVTTEDVIYDYAYASVEHSLRFDFISFLLAQPNGSELLSGDKNETTSIIEGYVAYFADQFVNQMELK